MVIMHDTDGDLYLSDCRADDGRVMKLEVAEEAGVLQTGACRGGRPKSSKKDGGYLVIACDEQGNKKG
jgi:hypothetical protein